jgi:hypothetical protein
MSKHTQTEEMAEVLSDFDIGRVNAQLSHHHKGERKYMEIWKK